jgi:transposase-like protein
MNTTGLTKKHFKSERAAREHLEKLFWPSGPVCPKCHAVAESTNLGKKRGTATHHRKGVYQCNACREQFTVTVGTIFEDTRVPLNKWLHAINVMSPPRCSISALALQTELGLGAYRTAYFMRSRIMWALSESMCALDLVKVKPDDTMPRPGATGKKKAEDW